MTVPTTPMELSGPIVLSGGEVVDGSGSTAVRAGVRIDGNRIVAVGQFSPEPGDTVIDVTGLTITPGFIDSHTHDDFAVLAHPDMAFKVRGGVTTSVVGNCGFGAAPHSAAVMFAESFHPGHDFPEWTGYRGYMELLEEQPSSLNVAVLMGHGTIRMAAMGGDDRLADSEDLARMVEVVEEGMEAGCLGLSTGLIYEPGTHADTAEVVALATAVSGAGGIYTSHLRNEGDGLLEALAEAISIGREAGLPIVISHLKAAGRENWGRVADALALIDEARDEGLTVAADQYPYTAGSTVLAAVVGQDALGSGTGGLGRIEPHDIVIAASSVHPEYLRRTVADIAEERGLPAAEMAAELVADDPGTNVILHVMSEDDVQTVMGTDGVMIGSDGLPTIGSHPHPRLYGTFARVLGHYARDTGLLTFEEAIHRMTGRTAEVFGFVDRGTVSEGAVADLVVLDRAAISDLATYDEPERYPAGIQHVFVSGQAVVANAEPTGARPGRVLRRG